MTKQEIAVLGHAFFDGKTLQYQSYNQEWYDWEPARCPDFKECGWRIKPDEPKTITICTFTDPSGRVFQAVSGTDEHKSKSRNGWTHIKSLDQVVEED